LAGHEASKDQTDGLYKLKSLGGRYHLGTQVFWELLIWSEVVVFIGVSVSKVQTAVKRDNFVKSGKFLNLSDQ
jgi:hypothetical protein